MTSLQRPSLAQVEYVYEDMTGAYCSVCLTILVPLIGIIIAIAIIASAPRGSRRHVHAAARPPSPPPDRLWPGSRWCWAL